jgi:hypothetical protein
VTLTLRLPQKQQFSAVLADFGVNPMSRAIISFWKKNGTCKRPNRVSETAFRARIRAGGKREKKP